MLDLIQQWARPPEFDDLERKRAAGLVHVILLVSILVDLVYVVLGLMVFEGQYNRVAIALAVLPLLLLLMELLQRGRVTITARLLVASLWLIFTVWTFVLQGLSGSTYVAYLFVILIAAYTIDFRFAVGATALSLVTVLLVGLAEQAGIVPLIPLSPNIVNSWIASALILRSAWS